MKIDNILSIDIDWIENDYQYLSLFNILCNKFKSTDHIIFIKSHHLILKYIEKETTIYNVDHHHDLIYEDGEECNEGNWVNFAIKGNKTKNYYWIHNYNSEAHPKSFYRARGLEKFSYTADINILNNLEFNKIIICESFEYQKDISRLNKYPLIVDVLKGLAFNIFPSKVTIDDTLNIIHPKNIQLC